MVEQRWAFTDDGSADDPDSMLTIELKKTKRGTALTLIHTNIPKGQTQYKVGWRDFSFKPMKACFG